MLKIWLTCLQPGLNILGVLLVLSNAVAANAGSKNTGTVPNKTTKGQSQQKDATSAQPQQFGATGMAGTTQQGVKAVDYGVSATPDAAVRQLALDTIANSQRKIPNIATKNLQQNNSGIASFVSPSSGSVSSITPKTTNAKFVGQSATAVIPFGSGLFSGNGSTSTFDQPIKNFPNLALTSSPAVLTVGSNPMAMVKGAEPSLKKVSEPVKPVGSTESINPAVRKSNPSAAAAPKGLEQFLGNEPKSIQPDRISDTTVAKGLEQFLGNEPKSIQTDSIDQVAQATPVKVESISALSELVSPKKAVAKNINGSSLQLATSKAYDNAADFDLPGVATQTQAVKIAQPKVKLIVVKTVKTNLSNAVVQRKKDYVALMSDKDLKSKPQQSWTTAGEGNSLGGLILGSRSSIHDAQASTNKVASLPINALKTNRPNGLGLFDPMNQY